MQRTDRTYHQIVVYDVERDEEGRPVIGSVVRPCRVSGYITPTPHSQRPNGTLRYRCKLNVLAKYISMEELFGNHASWVADQISGKGRRNAEDA